MFVTEYEARFCELSMHGMTIVLIELERVRRFLRELTLSIMSYIFRPTREGGSFQSIVSTTKEAELMLLEKF